MELPPFVVIVGQRYALAYMDEFTADACDALGLIDHTKLRIQIRVGMPAEKTVECLLHECAHGITYSMHTDDTEDGAEAVVDRIGRGFMALMKDNSGLFSGMLEALR